MFPIALLKGGERKKNTDQTWNLENLKISEFPLK